MIEEPDIFPVPAFLFVYGLFFGSFANVCAWRIPRGESIVFPRSHCPKCGASIPWYRNVPVASWLLLRGRCADCRAPISFQYPLVELICAFLFAAQGVAFPPGPTLLWGLVLSFGLLCLSIIDFHHQVIPDVFSLGLLAVGLLVSPWNVVVGEAPFRALAMSLAGAAFGFGLMFSVAWAGEKAFKKEALGGGDIKLMAALGAFLGWKGVLLSLFLGSLSGTAAALVLMSFRRLRRGDYLPFGPFLAFGGWAAWVGGERLSSLFFGATGLPFR